MHNTIMIVCAYRAHSAYNSCILLLVQTSSRSRARTYVVHIIRHVCTIHVPILLLYTPYTLIKIIRSHTAWDAFLISTNFPHNAERRVYGNISAAYFQSHRFGCVCPPSIYRRKIGSENRSRGCDILLLILGSPV